ncbi:arginine synthesis PII-interacting regulator PirA [Leptothoe spongobia]|uniref:DUF4278 domain-containing protein n=1 Tax=Leptothoe spongobia TAU-MAC 1115 TaxID=1967444 RepID=A0A947DFW1_9CYAN|nr:DUF4278 domain-containing protein [Leptothoe spongobia]MBT9316160.1 DUF4278 domain-containing protein [Leptothoe spongobia TAU-MAC 1115]
MKLTYRGIEYDHNPPMLEVSESDILCNYRGRSHRYTYVRHVPFPQTQAELTYRGATYQINRHGQRQTVEQNGTKSVFSAFQRKLAELTPLMDERRQLLRESARSHSDSIQRSLEHRITVAREQGNINLLQQLEDEMRQMA